MLGHSGAGKTTYVSLMYHAMWEGAGGFEVRANNTGQHQRLITDATGIYRGRYPDPTHQRAMYELTLRFGGQDVYPFSWGDYRGGALSDRSTNADVALLHRDLAIADGIVLFVDSHALLNQPRAQRDVRRLVALVMDALGNRDEVLTPLVVACTKYDLVPDVQDTHERLQAAFQPLIDAVAATEHVHGTILPVACGPDPVNVVVPVLWCLRFGVAGLAMRLAAEIEGLHRAAAYAEANDTFGDRITSWFKSEPTFAEIASRHRSDARQRQRDLQPLIEPAQHLDLLLGDLLHF